MGSTHAMPCFRTAVRVVAVFFFAMALLLSAGAWHPAGARSMSFADWLPMAQDGNPEAQCQIGVDYLNGTGVSQDFARGMYWLVKSSDAGFPYARFVLADVFNRGYAGQPVNYEKVYYYASLAAASTSLPEKFRDRAVKLRDSSAKQLSPAQVTRVQTMTALAPLHNCGID